MKKVKITNRQMIRFRIAGFNLLKAYEGKFSKFLYALKKAIDRTEKVYEEYSEAINIVQLDYAMKDNEGFVKRDENGSMKFTTAAQNQVNNAFHALEFKEIEVEPFKYTGDDVPPGITITNWDLFAPFVLDELTEAKLDELIARQEKEENDTEKSA